jgi:hypothetical protein
LGGGRVVDEKVYAELDLARLEEKSGVIGGIKKGRKRIFETKREKDV